MISSRQNCLLTSKRLTKLLPTSLSVLTNSSLLFKNFFAFVLSTSYYCYAVVNLRIPSATAKGFALSHEKAYCPWRQLHYDNISKNFRQAIFKGIFDFLQKKYGIFDTYKISTKCGKTPQDMEAFRRFREKTAVFPPLTFSYLTAVRSAAINRNHP